MSNFISRTFKGFFNRKSLIPDFTTHTVDLSLLDRSLEILNNTSKELIEVASGLNESLKQELKDTQYRLTSIMDSIDDYVLVKDSTGKWKRLNKFGEKLYNFTEKDYIDKTNEELLEVYPQYKEHLLGCVHSDELAWKTKQPCRTEESFEGKSFDIIKTPIYNSDGSKKELIIIGRDITELKEKRRRIKACFNALNASSDVIVITNFHNEIVFCNDKFIQKFNFHSHEEVTGKQLDIIAASANPFIYKELCDKKDSSPWSGIIINKIFDRGEVVCNVNMIPVMNGISYPIYYIYTMKATLE